jgi:cytochrome c-type biogenesis protein CcsB
MTNNLIFSYVTFLYFGAFIFYLLMLLTGRRMPGRLATMTLVVTIIAHAGGIVLRWIESYKLGFGRAPLSNLYESLVFFSWTVALIYSLFELRTKNKSLGVVAALIAFLAIAYASFSPSVNERIQPLIPALQSNWLISHVVTCFLGYAAFALSFGLSIIYLIKSDKPDDRGAEASSAFRFPDHNVIDELNHQMVAFGFIMLTLGIITGSVWAHSAWGSYWSWDPKETWSLITWLIYAAVLHSRFTRGWRGRRIALMNIFGFACVLFTYFGVNYLPGLHSYAT